MGSTACKHINSDLVKKYKGIVRTLLTDLSGIIEVYKEVSFKPEEEISNEYKQIKIKRVDSLVQKINPNINSIQSLIDNANACNKNVHECSGANACNKNVNECSGIDLLMFFLKALLEDAYMLERYRKDIENHIPKLNEKVEPIMKKIYNLQITASNIKCTEHTGGGTLKVTRMVGGCTWCKL